MTDEEFKKDQRVITMAKLLIECRDALPAITTTSARLHGVDLTLDKRIEKVLEPWLVAADDPNGI